METKNTAVKFTNWTDEKFTHKWDNVEYSFEPGKTEYLQSYLAEHFAKHLAQRECNKKNIPMTDLRFKEYYDECLTEDVVSAESNLKLEMEIEKINRENSSESDLPVEEKKKPGRPKKIKPEDDFAGK